MRKESYRHLFLCLIKIYLESGYRVEEERGRERDRDSETDSPLSVDT